MGENDSMEFHPLSKSVQKIVIYETKVRLYIIGSNDAQARFRVIKIDRTDPKELIISDDRVVYTEKEIRDLLNMIDTGNRSKVGQKMGSGFCKTISSCGIIGFVRFLEGYYIILITKRLKAAMLGHHSIYKIEDTAMIYIPCEDVRDFHPDEARYVKMFQAIDLSSNFYFSYSYDLTNTVQYNLADPQYLTSHSKTSLLKVALTSANVKLQKFSYVSKPNERYLWNEYLIEPIKHKVHHDWILDVIHGFVDQANVSIYGSPVMLTLIARRSNRFAGTRFLKRGANYKGDVANEVETEQIVFDSSISNFDKAKVTSFVQIRGSVPGHWSQDTTTMVPKPQIFFQMSDPMCRTGGRHFNQLMTRYGSPVVILNLVKKREKRRKHESLLSDYLCSTVHYLNIFLHEEDHIQYVHFDMARCSKKKDVEVMAKLAEIATKAINETGIFQSQGPYYWETLETDQDVTKRFQGKEREGNNGSKQTGIVRTNCVDCLDRTNTAQFVIAKVALGLQLHALGFLDEPHVEYDTDCSRILEAMFEDHGDTLALQYGGSQLIHRIKSYRKESKWTSRANDITQTVRRYYSNALTDAEKQNTMNLFLGVFIPQRGKPSLWDKDAPYDSYLHAPELCSIKLMQEYRRSLQLRWWDISMRKCLPFSVSEMRKECLSVMNYNSRREPFDLYRDHYHPHRLTVLSEAFAFKELSNSVRDYMPNCETEFSPFVVRAREGKRREESNANNVRSSFAALLAWGTGGVFSSKAPNNGKSNNGAHLASSTKNPSVAGTSSTASNTSQTTESSDEDGSSSEENFEMVPEIAEEAAVIDPDVTIMKSLTFEGLFTDSKSTFGIDLADPNEEDTEMYSRWMKFDKIAKPDFPIKPLASIKDADTEHLFLPFDYQPHDYTKELLPMPSENDEEMYERFVDVKSCFDGMPANKDDLQMYFDYVSQSARLLYEEDVELYQDLMKKLIERDDRKNLAKLAKALAHNSM